MDRTRLIILAVLTVLVILFALLVWPTLYRYDQIKFKDQVYPVRINRVTGKTERMTFSRWLVIENSDKEKLVELIPHEHMKFLEGEAKIGASKFELQLYNPIAPVKGGWIVGDPPG